MTEAAIYRRISQDREGSELGVERQEAECRELAERLGLTIVAVYTDNDTGASTKTRKRRPAFEAMLDDLAAGAFTTVVSYSMSRLTRRPREGEGLLELAEQGRLSIRTVASGDPDLTRADGRAMFRTLMAFDAAEAERISERVTAAAKQRAERGLHMGGPRRFGYSADGSELVVEEAEAIRWAYGHIRSGGSLRSAGIEWQRRGLTGPGGGRQGAQQVRSALLRSQNAGLATYKGLAVGSSSLPAIIDVDTFREVVEILNDPARLVRPGRPASGMLAGLIVCTVCGDRAYTRTRKQKGGTSRVIYACHGRGCVQRVRDRVDALIGGLVVAYLEQHRERLARPSVAGDPTASERAAHLRDRLDRLQRLFTEGLLDPEDYAAGAAPLRADLRAAEALLAARAGAPATAALLAAGEVAEAWAGLGVPQRRQVLRELIDRIELGPSTSRDTRVFTPEGISVVWRVR